MNATAFVPCPHDVNELLKSERQYMRGFNEDRPEKGCLVWCATCLHWVPFDWIDKGTHVTTVNPRSEVMNHPQCACAECEGLRRDAARYRWLRNDNAYAPEEALVRGGDGLDKLCDEGIHESDGDSNGQ